MKIERNCPHCKTRVYAHVVDYNVPTAYGANTPAAVLVQCPEPARSCGKQWRALLRKHEREEMEAEKLEVAITNMPRPEGWYWVLDSYGDWEPMYYNVKGWRTDFGSFCYTDEDAGEIGPMIGAAPPREGGAIEMIYRVISKDGQYRTYFDGEDAKAKADNSDDARDGGQVETFYRSGCRLI